MYKRINYTKPLVAGAGNASESRLVTSHDYAQSRMQVD